MTSTVKYDWYQSETHVTVTVLLKNAAEKNYVVAIGQNQVQLKADGIEPITIELWDAINADQSMHKAIPSKVEIKLAKLIGERWGSLSRDALQSVKVSAKKTQRDWDKIIKEVEKQEAEDPNGGEHFLKKIYADSTGDIKKAMMKSYYESGGTVLNTDWAEVAAKTVEVKPPEGCEYKEWK